MKYIIKKQYKANEPNTQKNHHKFFLGLIHFFYLCDFKAKEPQVVRLFFFNQTLKIISNEKKLFYKRAAISTALIPNPLKFSMKKTFFLLKEPHPYGSF